MSFLAASPFLNALGWALLNSIWQFALLYLIYWMIGNSFKGLTSRIKHTVAVYLLFAGSLFFLISLAWKYYFFQFAGSTASGFIIERTIYYSAWQGVRSGIDALMPYCSILYISYVILLFIKFSLHIRHANQVQQSGTQPMNAAWKTHIKKVAEQLGIKKQVSAFLSLQVDTPQVIGFMKPFILVPLACLTYLTAEQLEAILLHELVHIKRNDYLINVFITFSEIVFFFNPFVKMLVTTIRKEREYSCDDIVMQFHYRPQQYAAALLSLEKTRTLPVTFGIAASGKNKNKKQLLARIERIVGIKNGYHHVPAGSFFLIAIFGLALIATVNPVKIAIEKRSNNTVIPVNASNIKARDYKDSIRDISNYPKTIAPVKSPIRATNTGRNIAGAGNKELGEIMINNLQPVLANGEKLLEEQIKPASRTTNIDYSLPENDVTEAPAPELASVTPYVPDNSFLYRRIQDTLSPKLKGETYNELQASEAMHKAKKALEKLNWKKIEKQLKNDDGSLAKLKSAVASELAKLNWQQINEEVQKELQSEQVQKAFDAVRQEQLLKQYQQNEAIYEMLDHQLQERDQLLQETDKRIEEKLQQLQLKHRKIQEEMKKKRIVSI